MLSCYAAQHYGVTAYGVTLSSSRSPTRRRRSSGLAFEGKVRIELKDYSTVEGQFDKVAAIGIQEHIGWDNYPKYYDTVKRVMKREGFFLHHAITRPAKRTDKVFRRKRPEFAILTRYIFPGGELDHIGNTVASLERHGFEVHDVEGWREHYQRTCKHWHDRLANYDKAVAEGRRGQDAPMARLSRRARSIAFERNGVCLYQTLSSRRKRGLSGLPPTRADLYR